MMEKPSTSSVSVVFFITTLLLLFTSAPFVNSQTDSCTANLNLDGLPFDKTSLHCVPVWSPHNFILRYVETSPNLWSFVLSAPAANSYVAIGFSSNGMMVGSSAVVGWPGTIKQYFLGGQTPGQVRPDQGNLVINTSMVFSQSSRIYLVFQLNTAQPLSRLIYAVGPDGALPQAPDFTLTEHSDMVTTSLNYVT